MLNELLKISKSEIGPDVPSARFSNMQVSEPLFNAGLMLAPYWYDDKFWVLTSDILKQGKRLYPLITLSGDVEIVTNEDGETTDYLLPWHHVKMHLELEGNFCTSST